MKRSVLASLAAGIALISASPAVAGKTTRQTLPEAEVLGVNVITPNNVIEVSEDEFLTFFVSGNPETGPLTATLGHTGIPEGSFTDIFNFSLALIGEASGSITTSVNIDDFLNTTDLDILSVLVNGVMADLVLKDANEQVCTDRNVGTCGTYETWSINDVPLLADNTIEVNGISRGLGAYGGGGTVNAVPAVPEPGTWAMMLLGFGAAGYAMRRRRRPVLAQMA